MYAFGHAMNKVTKYVYNNDKITMNFTPIKCKVFINM
jgi:hypothetical protein